MISVSVGVIGSMYEISFECDVLKNRKMNVFQISSMSIGVKLFGWCGICIVWWMFCYVIDSYGRKLISSMGMKQYSGFGWFCFGVRYWWNCWMMKKKLKNLGLCCWMSMNYGVMIVKKIMRLLIRYRCFYSVQLCVISVYSMSMVLGRIRLMRFLDSIVNVIVVQYVYIQLCIVVGCSLGCCVSSSEQSDSVIQNVSFMLSVLKWFIRFQYGELVSMMVVRKFDSGLNRCVLVQLMSSMLVKFVMVVQRCVCYLLMLNYVNVSVFSQVCSGGFLKYL